MKSQKKISAFPSELSAKEKEEAEKVLWPRIQLESFGGVGRSVKRLNVIKDIEDC